MIVCDGFVGNVALKTSEGLVQMLYDFLKAEFTRGIFSKAAAAIAYPVLDALQAARRPAPATTARRSWA